VQQASEVVGGIGMAGIHSQHGPEVLDGLFAAPESGQHRCKIAPAVEPSRDAHAPGEGVVRRP